MLNDKKLFSMRVNLRMSNDKKSIDNQQKILAPHKMSKRISIDKNIDILQDALFSLNIAIYKCACCHKIHPFLEHEYVDHEYMLSDMNNWWVCPCQKMICPECINIVIKDYKEDNIIVLCEECAEIEFDKRNHTPKKCNQNETINSQHIVDM